MSKAKISLIFIIVLWIFLFTPLQTITLPSICVVFLTGFTTPLWAEEHNLSAEVLFTFGEGLLKQKRYVDAKIEFEKCLSLNPRHNQAKKLLRVCDQQITAKDKAMLIALGEIREKPTTTISKPKEKLNPEKTSLATKNLQDKESLAPPIQRGAWTLEKGKVYTELYTKYYWHNHRFDNKGKKKRWDNDGKGNEIRTELKIDYGFSEKLTLLLYTVAKEAHWKDNSKSNTKKGFVEMWPGAKYLLFEEPFICTLQARLKFPFDYSEEAVPALGTHQIDSELKVLTAQPWPKLPGYTKFEFGFKARNEEPTNEIPYFFEFGYNLLPQLILKTTLDGTEGLAQTGGNDEDWLKYTIGPIFKIKDFFNIEFGFGHTFYGKNTSAAKEIIISMSSQW